MPVLGQCLVSVGVAVGVERWRQHCHDLVGGSEAPAKLRHCNRDYVPVPGRVRAVVPATLARVAVLDDPQIVLQPAHWHTHGRTHKHMKRTRSIIIDQRLQKVKGHLGISGMFLGGPQKSIG